jgi:hypothetical protein
MLVAVKIPLRRSQEEPDVWINAQPITDAAECQAERIQRRKGNLLMTLIIEAVQITRKKVNTCSEEVVRYSGKIPFTVDQETLVRLHEVANASHKSHKTTRSLGGSKVLSCSQVGRSHGRESVGAGLTGCEVMMQIVASHSVFNIEHCRPNKTKMLLTNDWRPSTHKAWHEVWIRDMPQDIYSVEGELISAMEDEMKHDIILMYQTLFSQSIGDPGPRLPMQEEEERTFDATVMFLKRLFICFAVCKVTFCANENVEHTRSWPFPLASTLTHGGRILVRLDGVKWSDFLNFLLFGDDVPAEAWPRTVPKPFKARAAATHGIEIHGKTSQLIEKRLKVTNARDAASNLAAGIGHHHLGLDLPVGGIGTSLPNTEALSQKVKGSKGKILARLWSRENDPFTNNLYVGPGGVPWRQLDDQGTTEVLHGFQQGHLYVRWDDFGVQTVPVLKPYHPPREAFEVDMRVLAECHDGHDQQEAIIEQVLSNGVYIIQWPDSRKEDRVKQHFQLRRVNPALSRSSLHATSMLPSVADEDMHWSTLPQSAFGTAGQLQVVLEDHNIDIGDNQDLLLQLYRHLETDKDLVLEKSANDALRCRGMLLELVVEWRQTSVTDEKQREEEHRACDGLQWSEGPV